MAFKLRTKLKLVRGRLATGWAKSHCSPTVQRQKKTSFLALVLQPPHSHNYGPGDFWQGEQRTFLSAGTLISPYIWKKVCTWTFWIQFNSQRPQINKYYKYSFTYNSLILRNTFIFIRPPSGTFTSKYMWNTDELLNIKTVVLKNCRSRKVRSW